MFPIGLFYSKQTERCLLNIHISASKGTINPSRYGSRRYKTFFSSKDSFQYTVTSEFIHANIEASYLRNITSLSSNELNYWVGVAINKTAYYGENIAAFNWLLYVADVAYTY